MATSARSSIRRHPERAVPDEFATIMSVGSIVHVAFCLAGQPHVIPVGYHYDVATSDIVYLHGSRESRLLLHLATGAPAALCVTLLEGLVYSRHALMHTMNYRSAVCYGHSTEVVDLAFKRRLFEAMTLRYFAGRTAGIDYEPATDAQLAATLVVALAIEERSAKIRSGEPRGPTDGDTDAFGTCGVATPRRIQENVL